MRPRNKELYTSKPSPSFFRNKSRIQRNLSRVLGVFTSGARVILHGSLSRPSRKWLILVATMWIQACTGTNFDFSAYSSEMKAALGVSQVELSYLATASDLGKAVRWTAGVALMWLPIWVVLLVAGFMGLVGYGLQWLVILGVFSPPYFMMAGQSRKWMILVATIWIMAFTGTNFDFSAYSSEMKAALGLSQMQLNYLATASDLGKLLGWASGLALMWLPLWAVMLVAAVMGLVGYGLQWFIILGVFSPPYSLVFLLCLLSGCSICWFNTVCFVLCIKNFPANRALAISLTVSFNGVSAALYALAANAINPSSPSLYLFLNSVIPLLTTLAALTPILRQPELDPLPPDAVKRDSFMFLFLNVLAVITGFYLLFITSASNDVTSSRVLFGGALLLLAFPPCVPGIVYAREWFKQVHSSFKFDGPGFILVDDDDLEYHKEVTSSTPLLMKGNAGKSDASCECVIRKGQLVMLGEEHSALVLVRRVDFWLYYVAYFCGGTIGLVYSNNLGQIAQSLGQSTSTTTLLTLYSSFSFFGRLLSATPDYIRAKFYFARTGWLALALTPTPIAFFLLTGSGSALALQTGTSLIGLSSGFIFAAAVSITSELFGPSSVGVNHNILITNIPIGSLVYGLLAAVVYDANSGTTQKISMVTTGTMVCMGRQCYYWTFMWWGCISVVGLISSVLLFLRTRHAYQRFERDRISTQID